MDFYRYKYRHVWDELSVIKITKRKLENRNIYIDLTDEFIYVLGDIKGEYFMKEEKILSNTGVALEINNFENDKYEQMALKGKLEATEKRLAYYIDKCEALEQRIQNLKEKGYPIA